MSSTTSTTPKPVIAVLFYSTYGHIATLAEEVIKGVESTGAIVKPYVIQETLSEEVLTKMYAGSSLKPKYPIVTPDDLKEVDGFVLGAPTRYGRVPAQVSAFFDQTGGLWATGALVGKFVTQFTSAAGQHGGHETTAITTFPFYAHHGLVYVPIGYATPALGGLDEIQGGSPYGASTVAAADGSWQPKVVDLEIARFQGKYFADFVATFVKGKHAAAAATATAATATSAAAKEVPAETATTTSTEKAAGALEGYNLGPAIVVGDGQNTSSISTPAESSKEGTTVSPTPVPAPEQEPKVPAEETEKAAVTPTPAPAPAAIRPETETKAATPAVPAAAAAKPAVKKEKKSGFFSCCGSGGIDE